MSILVLALNPSIDAEWQVDEVQWEEKNVIERERRWAGGKGVNVARWLKHLGSVPQLIVPLGGETGSELAAHLRSEKLAHTIVRIAQPTRVNVIVTTREQGQLRFNPPGPSLAEQEWSSLLSEVEGRLPKCSCMVLSGSLPHGAPVNTYAKLIRIARQAGCRALLDCDGPSFASALRAKPFLVKPNEPELCQWAGRRLGTVKEVEEAARNLATVTGGWVLVSRGRSGAMLVHPQERRALRAAVPRVKTLNTVGAGDALLAAVARQVEQGRVAHEWLRWGAATGTVATQSLAGVLPKVSAITRFATRIKVE